MSDTPPKPSFLAALLAFLASGTGRRLGVFLVGFATITLNKKLGLDLDPNQVFADIGLTLGYVVQSAVKEASAAHAEAKGALVQANLEIARAQLPAKPADPVAP